MSDLKPCPFCDDGGRPVFHPEKGVKCHRCGCWGPDHDESSPYGWNTRAAPNEWQPLETAPKDGINILVWYDHEKDPYQCPENKDRLTDYAAWAEGGDFMDGTGYCIAAWQPNYFESTDEYGGGYYLPAFWFAYQGGDYETVVNPTHWQPLNPPETET